MLNVAVVGVAVVGVAAPQDQDPVAAGEEAQATMVAMATDMVVMEAVVALW